MEDCVIIGTHTPPAEGRVSERVVKNAEAQCEKGNKTAGTRARKASLELTKLLKDFRKASIEFSK